MSTSSSVPSSVLDTLTAAREQVRLKLHLLSGDARKKWDELDAKIIALEGQVGAQAEELADKTATLAMQLSDSVKEFVDSHVRNQQR
jgi:hypothetical protein